MDSLQLRIGNCIQTILELEPAIRAGKGIFFKDEFCTLKQCLERLEQMELNEADVREVERTTSEFLADIGGICRGQLKSGQILQ